MSWLIASASVVLCLAGGGAAAPDSPVGDPAERAAMLLAEQGALLQEGRSDEVLIAVDETILLYQTAGEQHGLAAALVLRGLARWGEGTGEASVADLAAALETLNGAGDSLGAALVLWLLGEAHGQEGRLESAERELRRALDRLAHLKASTEPLDLRGFEALGRIGGAPVEILKAVGPAVAFIEPLLLGFLEIPIRESLVGVLIERGALEEAERELDRAFDGAGLLAGLFDASLHRRRGDLRRRQWRLDEARKSYERALAAPSVAALWASRGGDVLAWSVLDQLAEVESLSGRFEAALSWNERALRLAREGRHRAREAMVLAGRAELYAWQGDHREAERHLAEAERIARETADDYRLAIILGDRGTYSLMRGAYETAAGLLEQSAALLLQLGEQYVAAPTLLSLVEAYQMMDAHPRTDAILERARELASASGFHQAVSLADTLSTWNRFVEGQATAEEARRVLNDFLESSHSLIGHHWPGSLLRGLGSLGAGELRDAESVARRLLEAETAPLARALARLTLGVATLRRGEAAAEAELRLAARTFRQIGHRDLEGMAQAAVAAVQWGQGRRDDAIESLTVAMESFEETIADVRVEELLASFLGGGRAPLFGLMVDMLAASDRPMEAFVQAERSRARAFVRHLANQRLRPLAGSDPALLSRADALRHRIGEWERRLLAAPVEVRGRLESDLRHARVQYEDLLVRLKVQNPEYAALAGVDPVTPAQIQATLEPDVSLINYYVSRTGAYAWLVERDRFQMVSLDVGPDDLREARCWAVEVARSYGSIERGGDERGVALLGGCEEAVDRERRLYDKLFAPLAAAQLNPRLVIVPHGPLHYLPFAALRDPERGRFLVEDYEVTLAPSAGAIRFIRGKESRVAGTALVLGAPATDDPRLPELPGAREEVVEVAALLGVDPMVGRAATEERVRESAGSFDLLHLAAHGLYHPKSPRFSRLALAPSGRYDGHLEVHEVLGELDLAGVNLVVLSACQSAAGPDAGGDEIVSLHRAFLYAGSPGVISTLWAVQDRASADLMTGFYGHLLAGRSAASALRAAQLDMIRTGRRHPYFWAGYTLTGDPRGRWGEAHRSASSSSPNRDSP